MEEGSNTIGVDARHGTVTSITARSSEAMDPGIAGLYSYMDTEFFRATLPLIRSLQICGLFYPKEYGKGVLPGETQRVGRRRGRVSPWKVYSILVVGLLSLNSLRMFAIFQTDEDFGPSILLKILWTSWMISCTVNSIACFYACHRYQCLPQFFLSWKDLDQEANAECIQHLRPRILICAIVGWIVASTNVGVAIYGLFFSGRGIFDFTIVPLKPTSIYSTAARIIYLVVHIYMSVAWSMVSAYAFIFCAALCKQFTLLGTEFRQKVNHEDGSFSGDLEHFRCRHQRLSRMVGNVDGFLRIYIASVYTQTIAGLCIIMYNLLYDKEMVSDAMLLSIHVFWCGGLAASLSILSVPAAMVSHAAHELFDDLHDIKPATVDKCQALQMYMFLNRLSGSTIGLTAAGIFVINKPTILTILGMLVTYFVLLVQFAPTPTCSDCQNYVRLLANYTEHCFSEN